MEGEDTNKEWRKGGFRKIMKHEHLERSGEFIRGKLKVHSQRQQIDGTDKIVLRQEVPTGNIMPGAVLKEQEKEKSYNMRTRVNKKKKEEDIEICMS